MLETGDTRRAPRSSSIKAQLGTPEEPAPAEAAEGAGQQAARAEDGARPHRRPQAAAGEAGSSATSRRTCSSCSTRRGTRCTSPTGASTSCRRTITTRSCCRLSQEVHRIDHDATLDAARRSSTRAPQVEMRVRGEERAAEHRAPAAARARAVREGRELRRAGRRGADRRRVHRPHDAGPPLVRRAAPGGRGQGRRPASRARRRRWPRSRFRTTSACTRSSPA